MPDDLANPQADLAMQHLEPVFGRPDEMIAMMAGRVATGRMAHRASLRLKPVSDSHDE